MTNYGRWDAALQAALSAGVESGKLGTSRPPRLATNPAGELLHTVAEITDAGIGLAARTAALAGISAEFR